MTRHIITLAILTGCAPTTQAPLPDRQMARKAAPASPSTAKQDTSVPTEDVNAEVAVVLTGASEALDFETAMKETTHAPTFALRRGETLAHFARWAELPVEVIAEHSQLDLAGTYPVGTEVSVPLEEPDIAVLVSARDAHHIERAEGYLRGRGGAVRSDFVTVSTGDTAWGIAHGRLDIPVWLLETYNPSADLDALRPGQELMYPVLGEHEVAEAKPRVDAERLALQ